MSPFSEALADPPQSLEDKENIIKYLPAACKIFTEEGTTPSPSISQIYHCHSYPRKFALTFDYILPSMNVDVDDDLELQDLGENTCVWHDSVLCLQ